MLNIQIDNPDLEKNIERAYGSDEKSIGRAFSEFIQHQLIRNDVGVSIEQLDSGQGLPMDQVMRDVKAKYE